MSVEVKEVSVVLESILESRVFGPVVSRAPASTGKQIETSLVRASDVGVIQRGKQPSSIEIARLVNNGMDGAYLRRLGERIPRKVIAATLGIAKSNLPKLYKRSLSKVQTDEINDLTLMWSELVAFFDGDDELLDEWLESSIPSLSGSQPIELLGTIVGRQVLHKTLDAMRYGEFA